MAPDSPRSPEEHSPIYTNLRNRLLSLDPHEVNITPCPDHPNVWGVLMETVFPEANVCLACLVDGTTSLYFSNGGGVLGSGTHPLVGASARKMTSEAEMSLEFTQPVNDYPLPQSGNIRFYLLTFEAVHSAECAESDLQSGNHPLSKLYAAGQDLITQIRFVNEGRQKG